MMILHLRAKLAPHGFAVRGGIRRSAFSRRQGVLDILHHSHAIAIDGDVFSQV
jgi:hypothetical protein